MKNAFWVRVGINIATLALVAYVIPGIYVNGVLAVVVGALALAFMNAFVRPMLIFFTLPLTVISLGSFILVINALCFWLAAGFVKGFSVSGFFSAFFGAIIFSLVSIALNKFVQGRNEISAKNSHVLDN